MQDHTMRQSRSGWDHPVLEVLFFIGTIVTGICIRHPYYLLLSFLLALLYDIRLEQDRFRIGRVMGLVGMMLVIAVLNPLFVTRGETVLWYGIGNRPFTLEALSYGCMNSLMLGSVLLWFACMWQVMTEEKWMTLLGGTAPSLTLVLTMTLGLVPRYLRRGRQIGTARACIGKGVDPTDRRGALQAGGTQLLALSGWALEGGVQTAASMEARGFGVGKRTSFSQYRWKRNHALRLLALLLLLAGIFCCLWKGGAQASYYPRLQIAKWNDPICLMGTILYGIFLGSPLLQVWKEDYIWHRFRSKI